MPSDPETIVTRLLASAKAALLGWAAWLAVSSAGGICLGDDGLPAYVRKDSFVEREVTVGRFPWALPGTLTLPLGRGPFSAVVLVHGSGPADRDEKIGPNRPFRDLAWGLASRGIVVLRYEKRTRQHPYLTAFSLPNGFTPADETVDDALAAVKLLGRQPEVDPKRVFVLGHSLGGMLVPRIAAGDAGIAGFIILAGANRPLEDIIVDQTKYIVRHMHSREEVRKEVVEVLRDVAQIKSLQPSDTSDNSRLIFGAPPSYWLDLRGYVPAKAAKELKRSLLILQGERDYQVTMADFGVWKDELSSRPDVTLKSYPGLNHMFIKGCGESMPAEYWQPGHVASEVIEDIATWILGVAGLREEKDR